MSGPHDLSRLLWTRRDDREEMPAETLYEHPQTQSINLMPLPNGNGELPSKGNGKVTASAFYEGDDYSTLSTSNVNDFDNDVNSMYVAHPGHNKGKGKHAHPHGKHEFIFKKDPKSGVDGDSTVHGRETPGNGRENSAARTIQYFFLKPFMKRDVALTKFHRVNLWERMNLERRIIVGTSRLTLQLTLFILSISSLLVAQNLTRRRDLYNSLVHRFEFDKLDEVTAPQDLWRLIPGISETSKDYFPTSSRYFSTPSGDIELHGPLTVFREQLVKDRVLLKTTEFSFQAYARFDRLRSGELVNVLKKRELTDTREVICYGWNVIYNEQTISWELVYGGHDYFPVDSAEHDLGYWRVSSSTPISVERGQLLLLTLVISDSEVKIFQDDTLHESLPLPRPLTDCNNQDEGIVVGDYRLELARVRYITEALSAASIHEVMSYGEKLELLTRGSKPETSKVEGIPWSFASVAAIPDQEISFLVGAHEQRAPDMPYGSIKADSYKNLTFNGKSNMAHLYMVDHENLREYYSVIRNKHRLSPAENWASQGRYIENPPSFDGTGVTFTMWWRHSRQFCSSAGTLDDQVCSQTLMSMTGDDVTYWTIILEESRVVLQYQNQNGGADAQIDSTVSPEFYLRGVNVWRHIAIQLDERTNRLRVFFDGNFIAEQRFSGQHAISGLSLTPANLNVFDANRRRLYFGGSFGQDGGGAEIYDLRMYPHSISFASMTPSQQNIFSQEVTDAGACASRLDHRRSGYITTAEGTDSIVQICRHGTTLVWISPPKSSYVEIQLSDFHAISGFQAEIYECTDMLCSVVTKLQTWNQRTTPGAAVVSGTGVMKVVITEDDGEVWNHNNNGSLVSWDFVARFTSDGCDPCTDDDLSTGMATGTKDGELLAGEIQKIANEVHYEIFGTNPDDGSYFLKCHTRDNDVFSDSTGVDSLGRGCDFYYSQKATNPDLCKQGWGSRMCNSTCRGVTEYTQVCWPGFDLQQESFPHYYSWDRIRFLDFETTTENGALCLADYLNSDAVFQECDAWMAGISDVNQDWDSKGWSNSMPTQGTIAGDHVYEYDCTTDAEEGDECGRFGPVISRCKRVPGVPGLVCARPLDDSEEFIRDNGLKRLNITRCEELKKSIDPGCSFDVRAVSRFSNEVHQNGGDFSIAFWVRQAGKASYTQEATFAPQITFLKSLSPPQQEMAVGRFNLLRSASQAGCSSLCGTVQVKQNCMAAQLGDNHFEGDYLPDMNQNFQLRESMDDKSWNFIAITRRNGVYQTYQGLHRLQEAVQIGESEGWAALKEYESCPANADSLRSEEHQSSIAQLAESLLQGDQVEHSSPSLDNLQRRQGDAGFSEPGIPSNVSAYLFFQAIEVNYPVMLSPIIMIPHGLSYGQIQSVYHETLATETPGDLAFRRGPDQSNNDRAHSKVDVVKEDFPLRSALIAPPLIWQSRANKTAICAYNFSTEWVKQEHLKAQTRNCRPPFNCESEVLAAPENVVSCQGEKQGETAGIYFGEHPVLFGGEWGFADFLYSLADYEFLTRHNENDEEVILFPEDFFDSQTMITRVVLVFYSAQYGISTKLNFWGDFSGAVGKVYPVVEHFEILEGDSLQLFLALSVLQMVCCAVLLADLLIFVVPELVKQIRETHMGTTKLESIAFKAEHRPVSNDLLFFLLLLDAIQIVIVPVLAWLRLKAKMSSAADTEMIFGKLSQISWDGSAGEQGNGEFGIGSAEKMLRFFRIAEELGAMIHYEDNLDDWTNIHLFIAFLRIVQGTSLHPRLALLTGTVLKAIDDFWHAFLLISILYLAFAAMATWRFGSHHDDFGDLTASLQTQFHMMFGEFPENWNGEHEGWALQAYTTLFLVTIYLMVLNFLMAIIVEAYMQVRAENEELVVESGCLTDMATSMWAHLLSIRYRWPRKDKICRRLEQFKSKYNVGYKELLATNLWPDAKSLRAFVAHYRLYDCLKPQEITRWGPTDPSLADQIARKVGDLFQTEPRDAAEVVRDAIFKTRQKRATKLDQLQSNDFNCSSVKYATSQSFEAQGTWKALLIGCNYYGSAAELRNSITDVEKMRKLLISEGFDPLHITVMTDDLNGYLRPTKPHVLRACQQLSQGVRTGDVLFFHFVGHGSQQVDPSGREADGYDETLVCCDGRQVTDDDLWTLLVYSLPKGVRLTAVVDCSHSGTVLDLPYAWEHGEWTQDEEDDTELLGDVQLFSACSDNEEVDHHDTPHDHDFENEAAGLLTNAFIRACRKSPLQTYPQFLQNMNEFYASRGSDLRPQLSSSHRFDTARKLFALTTPLVSADVNHHEEILKKKLLNPNPIPTSGGPTSAQASADMKKMEEMLQSIQQTVNATKAEVQSTKTQVQSIQQTVLTTKQSVEKHDSLLTSIQKSSVDNAPARSSGAASTPGPHASVGTQPSSGAEVPRYEPPTTVAGDLLSYTPVSFPRTTQGSAAMSAQSAGRLAPPVPNGGATRPEGGALATTDPDLGTYTPVYFPQSAPRTGQHSRSDLFQATSQDSGPH